MTKIISEHIRDNISKLVDKATEDIDLPEQVRYLATQLMYEAYKIGFKDCTRFLTASINQLKEDIDK